MSWPITKVRMQVLVKRFLRKNGYPPDLQYAAVQTALQRAAALSSKSSMPRHFLLFRDATSLTLLIVVIAGHSRYLVRCLA
jgi:hypothetical protein